MNAITGSLVIEMLPAQHGDAILVSYGPAGRYRMLVDAGPRSAWTAIRPLIERQIVGAEPTDATGEPSRLVDLMVVTHVDTDHIEGVLLLLRDQELAMTFGDIWFNDYEHLLSDRPVSRGGVQGAYLGALLNDLQWNEAWGRRAVRLYDNGASPVIETVGESNADGETFTLLSPSREQAQRMARAWEEHCRRQHLPLSDVDAVLAALEEDGRYRDDDAGRTRAVGRDRSAPNGSSIAFLFESGGRCIMLTGDAHPGVLVESLRRVCAERQIERLRLDAFKVSHHGSRGNITAELLDLVDCQTFLVSTNGSIFGHPDPETIDLIAARARHGTIPTVWFNYDSPTTRPYRDRTDIDARYGTDGHAIIEC